MPHRSIPSLLCAVILALGLFGCGESGSDPPAFAEVRFQVVPVGEATFQVDSLISAGTSLTSVVGQKFTATSTFSFVVENAPPPFQGKFTLVSGDQITATLTQITPTGQIQVSDTTGPGKLSVSVEIGGPIPGTPGPSNPDVRFDVCAPLAGQQACAVTGAIGSFGVPFNGTIGDQFTSHLVSGATPSMYFFNNAQENVNAVFARAVTTGDILIVQLFVDGQLRQTQASTGDVVIREDL